MLIKSVLFVWLALCFSSLGIAEEQGLVAYYDFNEGSELIAHDRSGNKNDGKIIGATWVKGRYGTALEFDGINDYVDCGEKPSFDVKNVVTLEAWVLPTKAPSGEPAIVGKKISRYALTYYKNGNCYFYISAGVNHCVARHLAVGVWHHIVATFDGTTMNLYVDGDLKDTRTSLYKTIDSRGGNLFIGKRDNDYFCGIIDEVRIYNRTLSEEEIQTHYQSDARMKKAVVNNKTGTDTMTKFRYSPDQRSEPLPPWPPVEVRKRKVIVWGREYTFSNLPIPVSIISQGQELLASSPKLEVLVEGKPLVWQPVRIERISPAVAKVISQGKAGDFLIQGESFVEFDGLVWVQLRLSCTQEKLVSIKNLSLKIPLKSPPVQLFSHQLVRTANFQSSFQLLTTPEQFYYTGALPHEGWKGEFTPQVWVGNVDRGLAWISESPHSWEIGHKEAVLELIPDSKKVWLNVTFVSIPIRLEKERNIEFGLMATPVKPWPTDRSLLRVSHTGGGAFEKLRDTYIIPRKEDGKTGLDDFAKEGVRTLVLWDYYSDVWGFPKIVSSKNREFAKAFVQKAHKLGIRVMPYQATLQILPERHPEFEELKKRFQVYPQCEEKGYHKVKLTDDFIMWYASQAAAHMREFDLDGYYLDTFNDPDRFNHSDVVMYDILQTRKLYKALYEIVYKEKGKHGIIFLHDSAPPLFPLASFSDLRLTGEMQYWRLAFQHLTRSSNPLLQAIPLEQIQVWDMGEVVGVPTVWCWKHPDKEYRVRTGLDLLTYKTGELFDTEEVFSIMGLFHIPIFARPLWWRSPSPVPRMSQIWKLEDEFGLQNARWYPYWENAGLISVSPPEVKVSFYLKEDCSLLMHVANLGEKENITQIKFTSSSGLKSKRFEIINAVGSYHVRGRLGGVELRLPPGQSTLLMLRVKK